MKKSLLILPVIFQFLIGFAQENNKKQIDIYGQIMTDVGYNFNQINPLFYDVMRPSQLPSFKNQYGTDGNTYFSVRQSSMGFRSTTDTKFGELKARFDFDLFGVGPNAGQTTFHILYAWVELGKLGVGHHWSLFCDFDGFPNILEYWGPSGMSLCKNVQIRYVPINGKNRFAIALERPGASADEGIYLNRIELANTRPKFTYPDVSAEFRMTRTWGYAELATVVRKIEWIDLDKTTYDLSGSAIGWGFNLSTNIKLDSKNIFKGQAIYGEGIENYMNDAPTDIALKNHFEDPVSPVEGVTLPLFSFSAYIDHKWNDQFSSALGYSAITVENTNGESADAFRKGQYASTNLLYYPLPNLMAGAELIWIRRDNYNDGWNSSATKIQFSCRYIFSHSSDKR